MPYTVKRSFQIDTIQKKLFFFCILLIIPLIQLQAQSDLRLWYSQPARNWNEALPIGNGRLGAMIFGNPNEDLLQLNEETLWSGGPANTNPNPHAVQYLPQVREALFNGDYKKAEELTAKMQGVFTESYEPLGDLRLKFDIKGEITGYYRDLDLSSAIATTRFTADGVEYQREYFSSAPDQVIVVKLTANKKGALNFSATTASPLYFKNSTAGSNEGVMRGNAPMHTDPSYMQSLELPVVYNDPSGCKGMRYEVRIRVESTDGKISTTDNGEISVRDATEAVLFVSAATSFNGFDKCPLSDGKDESKIAKQFLQDAAAKSFGVLREKHSKDYQSYFNRLGVQIEGSSQQNLPTDERLRQYSQGKEDIGLEILYFQFGRYLLISSSRPGGIPANLQGIWNHHVRPPWSSNYTTNINTEMNYWMAESGNLSELHEPLLQLIHQLSITGKETTKNFYGAPGWTVHHNTDIWATSNPVSGSPMWANWPLGGAWLSQHLWLRYQYTGDKKYLLDFAYPIMKGAAEFCAAWMIENKEGFLVTAPATSPENVFIAENGVKSTVSIATTMDMSLIWDLFTNVIEASTHLGVDEEFRRKLIEKRSKLYPLQIGKKGNLQEWFKDWDDEDPQHRHISHLFGLFPGRQISPLRTAVTAAAARRSLELRGDGGTGWSKGWKINTWARLHDGNHAYKLLREQLKLTGMEGTDYANGGGTYPNLFDAHPPFQIDGNFGGTSGMIEMILQSHDEFLHLLPALPDAWRNGKITGVKAKGGYTIDMEWKNKKITTLKIHSSIGNNVRLLLTSGLKGKYIKKATGQNPNPFYQGVDFKDENKSTTHPQGFKIYDLKTEPGKTYVLKGL
jgi:alpha-L-fucosidase 2